MGDAFDHLLQRGTKNAGQEPFLYCYRDKDAREIDLLLEQNGKLFPIEIKKMAASA